jgi:rSAM/selenodomain-associated transferase 2
MRLSIIIPVCDEGEPINRTLDPLVELRQLGVEVIAVDGGSRDATIQRARLRVDRVLSAPRGRASQVNAGAEKASGDVLLFLDPGARLPPAAEHLVLDGLAGSGRVWGRFNVRIEGRDLLLPAVGFIMNRWSCLGGIAAFEQAIFVNRDVFLKAGGYPLGPMADVEFCKRLRRTSRPLCIGEPVRVPGQSWEANGVWRTAFETCRLRLAYFLRTQADLLAKRYADIIGRDSRST